MTEVRAAVRFPYTTGLPRDVAMNVFHIITDDVGEPDSTRLTLIRELDLNPVIEMSLAVRVGIGKELREGVFSAGITLSVYGIFEGALATPRDPRFRFGHPVPSRQPAGHGAARGGRRDLPGVTCGRTG